MHIGFIGASGKVGRQAVQYLYMRNKIEGLRLTLVSRKPDKDKGLLLDIRNTLPLKSANENDHFHEVRVLTTDDYRDLKDADAIVVAAAAWPTKHQMEEFDKIDNTGRMVQSVINYKVSTNVLEVVADYLAVGIDPRKTKIVLQSQLSDIALLYMIFSNLVTVARVERNPTVKDELKQKGLERDIPLGFFSYPVSQAADIAAFRAAIVPVGQDQIPMIEITNEIVRRFNRVYGRDVLVEAQAVVPKVGRLPGVDGKAKMSKSLGNAINLGATPQEIETAVKMMFTDPGHLRAADPGKTEGNVVFAYLDVFDPDQAGLATLKDHYRRGGLGDSVVKKRLNGILQDVIAPIRAARARLENDRAEIVRVIEEGTAKANEVVAATLSEVRSAMGINYRANWAEHLITNRPRAAAEE